MATRQGTWQDLLGTYSRALGAKKMWLGLVGVLGTVLVVWVAAQVYALLAGCIAGFDKDHAMWHPIWGEYLAQMRLTGFDSAAQTFGAVSGRFFLSLMRGEFGAAFAPVLPLLNPFGGPILHFALSVIFYLVLLRIWTYCGGAISRVTALEYARDDLPTLQESTALVRARRGAYFQTPAIPMAVVLVCVILCAVIGLIGSIPHVGPWLMVPGYLVAALLAVLAAFFVVVGLLSFGLMMPVVSIGGGDAFESWSASYSYALWGFSRLVVYRLVMWAIGVVAIGVVFLITDVFVDVVVSSVGLGLMGEGRDLLRYAGGILGRPENRDWMLTNPSAGLQAAMATISVVGFGARSLVLAYVVSYYFTGNTIITFLLRKHVDRIDVDEVYMPEEEEPAGEGAEADEPAAAPESATEGSQPPAQA